MMDESSFVLPSARNRPPTEWLNRLQRRWGRRWSTILLRPMDDRDDLAPQETGTAVGKMQRFWLRRRARRSAAGVNDILVDSGDAALGLRCVVLRCDRRAEIAVDLADLNARMRP